MPAELAGPGVELVAADLRRPGAALADAIAAADAVVHLAAGTTGSPRARFDATVLATERLIAGIREADWRGRLVHVSTLAVYAFAQLGRRATIDERTPLEPRLGLRDDYAWTKGWQERLVRELSAAGPCAVTIVRPGAVHGPGRTFPARLGRRLGERTVLLIGGAAAMPLVQVDNLASLLVACAEHPGAGGLVLNAVDPDPPRHGLTSGAGCTPSPGASSSCPSRAPCSRAAGQVGRLTRGRSSRSRPGGALPDGAGPQVVPLRHDDCLAPARVAPAPVPRAALERTFAREPAPARARGSCPPRRTLVGGG